MPRCSGRTRSVDRLLTALGGASKGLDVADLLSPGCSDVQAARTVLAVATEAIASVARQPDRSESDLVVVARAWEAIAVAQDMLAISHECVIDTRAHRASAATMRADARVQAQRARAHAERLRLWRQRRQLEREDRS